MTMRHAYYSDVATRLNDNLHADELLRTIAKEHEHGKVERKVAIEALRAVGCFEAEIQEYLG